MNQPTEKQLAYVGRIIEKLGRKEVLDYVVYHFPHATIDELTKEQAQKIITGLGHRIAKPIYGVAGRDVPW